MSSDAIEELFGEYPRVAAGDQPSFWTLHRAQVQHRANLKTIAALRKERDEFKAELERITARAQLLGLADDLRPYTPEELATTPEEGLAQWRAWGRAVMTPPKETMQRVQLALGISCLETVEFSDAPTTSNGRVVITIAGEQFEVPTQIGTDLRKVLNDRFGVEPNSEVKELALAVLSKGGQ